MAKTVLAMGVHYDDCVYGVPGILLKAVRQGHRVVILSMIGRCEQPAAGRGYDERVVRGTVEVCREYGAEMRYLDFAAHRTEPCVESIAKVAGVVADVQPDVALVLWPHDHHHDHEVASRICRAALENPGVLDGARSERPRQMYYYDNGPGHTIGFEPDTYVDVSDVWQEGITWLGRMVAMAKGHDFDPDRLTDVQQSKETLSRYRGRACGVRHAEAIRKVGAFPEEIL